MEYRSYRDTDCRPSLLGLGCMRLPTLEPGGTAIDYARAGALVDEAVRGGITYFDVVLKEGAEMVCLVKPQFEAGKDKVGKKGVVREPQIHREVIEKVVDCAQQLGFSIMGLDFSPIKGPEGNIEYLLFLQKPVGAEQAQLCLNEGSVGQVVQNAHESLS